MTEKLRITITINIQNMDTLPPQDIIHSWETGKIINAGGTFLHFDISSLLTTLFRRIEGQLGKIIS